MSTKKDKRKGKKRGGRRAAPASSMPKQTKDQLKVPKGGKGRNWASLKERYLAYEFLTYTEMSRATGIPEGQIGKHAAVGKNQIETWKDERTRLTQELADARHEKDKRAAGDFNAKLREQILLSADTLEAVGRNSLILKDGTAAPVTAADAVRAVDASARIKQALIGPAPKGPTTVVRTAAEREDGEEDEPQGIIVVPAKEAAEAWLSQQRARGALKPAEPKAPKKPKTKKPE